MNSSSIIEQTPKQQGNQVVDNDIVASVNAAISLNDFKKNLTNITNTNKPSSSLLSSSYIKDIHHQSELASQIIKLILKQEDSFKSLLRRLLTLLICFEPNQHTSQTTKKNQKSTTTTTTTQLQHKFGKSASNEIFILVVVSFLICILLNEILSAFIFRKQINSVLVTLVIFLASVGASFGLRKMYVKALLKIFEYATNIKEEKLKECEELIEHDDEKNDANAKQKKMARLKRLRLESFMLNPPTPTSSSETTPDLLESASKNLKDIDKQNNNYLETNNKITFNEANILTSISESKNTTLKQRGRTISDLRKNFQLGDIIDFVHNGLETIIDDAVTKRFTTEELTVWNLLSRTNQQYEYVSFRVTVLWLLGMVLRYFLLFPARLILFIFACLYTFVSTFFIGLIKNGSFKRWLNWYATLILHRILSRVFSAIITFHNRENKAKPGSICVANHTSPIDVIILSTDNCYSMIGQTHGGFTGMMQRAFSRASNHIWFDRSESKDRGLVARRMREHVHDKNNLPILIFPEGTCINNTSVMMFKKGCFEIDTTIYPVAIKYDLRFGDAFWNSTKHTMLQYLILMMTSWAIVVDVYYLPPMEKHEDEDATQFASRVKSEIVKKGSFVDLNWDGMLKRTAPKLDLMYQQQQKYVSQLKLD